MNADTPRRSRQLRAVLGLWRRPGARTGISRCKPLFDDAGNAGGCGTRRAVVVGDDLGSDDEHPSREADIGARHASSPLPTEDARESDALASKLAYESGWRLCEDALRTLVGQRTIAVALLSLTLPAAGIAASLLAGSDPREDLALLPTVGWAGFAGAAFLTLVCAVPVFWPIATRAALGPQKIIKNYVESEHPGRTANWVYKNLARDLANAYDDMHEELTARSRAYRGVLVFASCAIVAAGIVVVDAVLR